MMNEVLASVSAADVQDAQSEHYRLDSAIRSMTDRMSLDEKRDVIQILAAKLGKKD